MKAGAKVLIVLALAALLGCSLLACGGGGSGPEAAVEGALEAFGNMDAEKTASYFPEDEREEVIAGLEFAFELVDDMNVSNIKTSIVSQTETTATVEANWRIEATFFGETESDDVEDTMRLEKVGGEWLIVESGILGDEGM